MWNFFRKGEKEEEMICQLCPKHTVIRTKHGSTSNMLRHVRKFHAMMLMKKKSKPAVRGKQDDFKMIMEEKESAFKDDEDEIIQLISEPLV